MGLLLIVNEKIMKLYKITRFSVTNIYQTIFKMPEVIKVIEKPRKDYGKGGFVVITGVSSIN